MATEVIGRLLWRLKNHVPPSAGDREVVAAPLLSCCSVALCCYSVEAAGFGPISALKEAPALLREVKEQGFFCIQICWLKLTRKIKQGKVEVSKQL